ncbi:uncharacterized protein N7469_004454 [Penicillium citrinum]|uniref:Uncharacterized protein n=1 Tax=Penicillium citrinum TaxID=5077 RepID=A0A9W9P4T1_PENCI|nr:uncharacterized protein N7469_004454 [Penicillium citrinum]KAJ5235286.1 hypothetical protein N7469_004454 [Penicillium citrinum]
MMPTGFPHYTSPKRKREPSESDCYSPSASPTSTVSVASFQETRLREDIEQGRHSPRAAVAGRFGQLAIRGDRFLGQTPPGNSQGEDIRQVHLQLEEQGVEYENHKPKTMPEALPPITDESVSGQDLHQPPGVVAAVTDDAPTTPKKSSSRKRVTPSPKKKQDPISPSNSRKQRLSPPIDSLPETTPEDPFTWHDNEITGHNPSDPTDDGYGINGVGFKPTAAMAWARSQKRQKQVADWKSREAREARERRRERRNDGMNLDSIRSIHEGAIQKRVKFDV